MNVSGISVFIILFRYILQIFNILCSNMNNYALTLACIVTRSFGVISLLYLNSL